MVILGLDRAKGLGLTGLRVQSLRLRGTGFGFQVGVDSLEPLGLRLEVLDL